MIHAFTCLGQYFVLDVDTASLHRLDALGYEVVQRYEAMTLEEIKKELPQYSGEEIEEVLSEIEALKAQGRLFTDISYREEAPQGDAGVIKAMCLHVAHDCNLRCKYCFADTGEYHGTDRLLMPEEVGRRALEYLMEKSAGRRQLEVDFFGGEPLMNYEVVKALVAYGRELEKKYDKQIRFTITTNAYGLNDEMIDFFNREMNNVVLSIDGKKETHDFMRPTAKGTGSYDLVLKHAKRLAQARNQEKYFVRGTFTRKNLHFAEDVLSLADEGFEQISIEPVVLPDDSPYAILEEDLDTIKAEYEVLLREYLKRRSDGRWFSFFHFNVDIDGGPCIKKRLSGCGAGREYVAVTPEGDIYPCHQFVGREGYRLGNVLQGDALDAGLREQFAGCHVLNKKKCADCWAKYFCSGGCAANAQAFHQNIMEPYERECELEQKRLECALCAKALEQ